MTPKENYLRAIQHNHPQWVPTEVPGVTISAPVVERPGEAVKDDFGVQWSLEEGASGGTYPTLGGHTITDLAKWREQITIPNVDAMDWQSVRDQAAEAFPPGSENMKRAFVEFGLYERSYLLLGMEEALMAYITDQDLMEEMISAIADYKIELITRLNAEAGGLDVIWYGDDWGNQSQLFMPPDVWRKIIKPHTKRIYDCIHECGAIVDQHSCGRIDEIFADMVEIGCDMFNPCQPCNDLAGMKKQFGGQITFIGGIDSQFVLDRPGVTCQDVRAEVRKRIDELAPGGGYIAGPSHGVPYEQELIDAMYNEIEVYGRAFYARENA